jgi:tetratricopeptide (TPR) repeat protein
MFKKIPEIAVYVVLFLTPLFTLPFTSNVLDFQKQFALFIIASVGFFFWIWQAMSEKKLEINLNPLHFFVAGFAVVALISSIFSLYGYGSLWGVPLPTAESFVTILSFIFLYFLIVNNFKREDIYKLLAVGAVSAAIAAVFAIIQSFGFYLLPFLSYTKDPSFNTIGTTSSLALYLAVVLATILPLLFMKKNSYRRLMAVCGGFLFLALVFFNGIITVYFPAKVSGIDYNLSMAPWIVLAVSALATFVFSVSDQKFLIKNSRAKNASFMVMFVAFLFLVFNIFAKDMMAGIYGSSMNALHIKTASEVTLQQRTAADISINTLKQSAQTFFLGSGPGTFVYDYIKFKPQSLSQDNFAWNITFYAGASEIINRVATTGLLGIIALMLIIVMWTAESFRTLTGEEGDEGLPLAIFAGWLAIVAAMFYYPFNLSLAMLFWIFLGLIIAMNEKKMVSLPLKSVRLTYAVTLAFVAVMILELGLLVWNAKRYYAEAEYLGAVNALQKNDLTGAIRDLESAANSTDRLQDNYLTGLSQIYLAQAQQELSKQNIKPEDAIKAASPYIQTAVQAAMLSTNIANPNNSANWAARGYVYLQLVGISDGFDTWAIDMYNKALNLEPNNPSIWTQLGQVYVMKKDLAKARDSFNKAVTLRPQLIDPHYYLAVLDDQQGDKAGAINELEIISGLLPDTDQTSKDNVAKAIENLKEGKSLSGATANPSPQTSGDSSQGQISPADGSTSAPSAVSASQNGTPENGSVTPPTGDQSGSVIPQSANPKASDNIPVAKPVKK